MGEDKFGKAKKKFRSDQQKKRKYQKFIEKQASREKKFKQILPPSSSELSFLDSS